MERQELKLFKQLYQLSKPLENDNLETLQNKEKLFDINPNLNYKIMKKMLDKKKLNDEEAKSFYNFFRNYIQTLFYHQKKEIIEIIDKKKEINQIILSKFKLNKSSFVDCFFDILEKIYIASDNSGKNSISIDYNKILDLFLKDYFVDNFEINTPLIYGTNELIFAGLINDLFLELFTEKNKDSLSENIKDVIKEFNQYPTSIMKKIDNKKKGNDSTQIENNNNQKNEMNNDKEINSKIIYVNKAKLIQRIKFITPYLYRIISKDFKEIFDLENFKNEDSSNSYEPIPKLNFLILHLLYFEFILHIYTFCNKKLYINEFNENFFFETKDEKIIFFSGIIPKNLISITNKQGKIIESMEDIKNEDYIIHNLNNKEETFTFNPFDYTLSKIEQLGTYEELKQILSDPGYFSLNKFFKENKLFNNNELSLHFNENIKEMISSKTIEAVFNQYNSFKEYICPYLGKQRESFISQTSDIIYYFPIPFKNISGYTYKKFGLIFINNKDRIEKRRVCGGESENELLFCNQINKISFYKVVHIHELISHYSFVIVHSNNKNISTLTPSNTFSDYYLDEEYAEKNPYLDSGDKAESLLFGNKIKYIYTIGGLFILDNNNYKKDLDKFKNDFCESNKIKKEDCLNIMEETRKSPLIKLLSKEKNIVKNISLNEKNVSNFRITNILEENNYEDENYSHGVSYFERSSHVFHNYKKSI